MAKPAKEYAIQSQGVRVLSKLVEESTRSMGDMSRQRFEVLRDCGEVEFVARTGEAA